jgi:hypothetical protein
MDINRRSTIDEVHLGTDVKPRMVKINAQLEIGKVLGSGTVVEGIQ